MYCTPLLWALLVMQTVARLCHTVASSPPLPLLSPSPTASQLVLSSALRWRAGRPRETSPSSLCEKGHVLRSSDLLSTSCEAVLLFCLPLHPERNYFSALIWSQRFGGLLFRILSQKVSDMLTILPYNSCELFTVVNRFLWRISHSQESVVCDNEEML